MTNYAVISDVHANLEALQAVLKKIEEAKADYILFLGDSVGYGPNPNECIELLKDSAKIMLAGNHDRAATGMTDISNFNPYARAAIEWTRDTLHDDNKTFLDSLPLTHTLKKDDIYLVHSSPKEPEKWHYISYEQEARKSFRYFDEKICFLGHSHIPFIVERSMMGKMRFYYDSAEIKKRHRYIINAGSVGQPRDGNPHAAYILLKDNNVSLRRVPYNIALTQKKMSEAGLPSYLINRLSDGR